MSASHEIQANVNTLERRVQTGLHDDGTPADEQQVSIWFNDLASKRDELTHTLAEEAQQQERQRVEEEEIESIKLPYDFEELFGEEDHPVPKLNEMIIEVVKDTKRQANIEKNQALDEQKNDYEQKLSALKVDCEELEGQKNILLTQNEVMESRERHLITERDDAYSKRDAAFRQLLEAQEEIKRLQNKLENAPQTKQLDISASDKLAIMVKESLADKVARGLARWKLEVEDVNTPVLEEEAPATEETFQADQVDSSTDGLATESSTDDRDSVEEESEVDHSPVTKAEFEARVSNVEKGMEMLMRKVFGEVAV